MFKVKHTPSGLFYKPQKIKVGSKSRRKDLHDGGKLYDSAVNATRALRHLERYGYHDHNGTYFKDAAGEFEVEEVSFIDDEESMDDIVSEAMKLYESVLIENRISKVLILTRADLLDSRKAIKDIEIDDFDHGSFKRIRAAEMAIFFDKKLPLTSAKIIKDRYRRINKKA